MSSSSVLRLVLVDDHRLFRHGLRLILSREPGLQVIAEAGSAEELLGLLPGLTADLFLLDVHLPGGDGVQLAAEIRKQFPAARVLMLSSDADPAVARRALSTGVNGYLLKDEAPQDLLRAIQASLQGGLYLCPTVAAALVKDLQTPTASAPTPAPAGLAALSVREREVLVMTAQGKRTKEIAAALGIGLKSVETYRRRVQLKLKLEDSTALVRYAVREGLLGDQKA